MNRQVQLSLIIFIMCALGCSAPVTSGPDALAGIPEDTLITLDRHAVCDGICPSYRLTISADGSVTYEGKHSVRTKGLVGGKIRPEELAQLLSQFQAIDFFSLRNRYSQDSEDCTLVADHGDSIITSIRVNGRVKEVNHWSSCMTVGSYAKLADLEHSIEETVNVRQWVE